MFTRSKRVKISPFFNLFAFMAVGGSESLLFANPHDTCSREGIKQFFFHPLKCRCIFNKIKCQYAKTNLVSRSSDDTKAIFSSAHVIIIAIYFISCGPGFFRILFYLFIFVLKKSYTLVYTRPILFRIDYSRYSYKYLLNIFFAV